MRSFALLILLLGIVAVTIGYTKMQIKCPPPRIEYRYVPRTFYEEQIASGDVIKNFDSMFSKESPTENRFTIDSKARME